MTELPDPRTDDVLLHAIAQQDVVALAELYRRYASQGLALAYRHGLSDPEQALEDGFLMLFRSAHGFARSSLPASVWTLGMLHWSYCTIALTVTPLTRRRT